VSEDGFERVAPIEDFAEGVPTALQLLSGEQVCLIRVQGDVYGIAEECTHGESPMSDGAMVDDYIIECAMHCAQFDVRDGSVLEPPAEEPIQSYEVKVADDYVWVRPLQS
jgi:3-phenylpropionate/trans-cinnamate dioxygenase ferredoxin subunit